VQLRAARVIVAEPLQLPFKHGLCSIAWRP
jgi:hypothetical protein